MSSTPVGNTEVTHVVRRNGRVLKGLGRADCVVLSCPQMSCHPHTTALRKKGQEAKRKG